MMELDTFQCLCEGEKTVKRISEFEEKQRKDHKLGIDCNLKATFDFIPIIYDEALEKEFRASHPSIVHPSLRVAGNRGKGFDFRWKVVWGRGWSLPMYRLLRNIREQTGRNYNNSVCVVNLCDEKAAQFRYATYTDEYYPPVVIALGAEVVLTFKPIEEKDAERVFCLQPGVVMTLYPSPVYEYWTVSPSEKPALLLLFTKPISKIYYYDV